MINYICILGGLMLIYVFLSYISVCIIRNERRKRRKEFIVPENDIKKLEDARIKLCNLTSTYPEITQKVLFEITPAIWQITHRDYPIF